MTIESEVANLTTQTTALLSAVNVSKAALDAKVDAANAQAELATTNGAAQVELAANQVTLATNQANIATTKAAEAAASAATATTKANAAETARAAAVTAQNNAVAVVTGGTGSLQAAPGKLPLADAEGKLDASWFTSILPLFGPLMPQILFGYNEPGAWYDPSDMSTLFQDSAGTVPVTAVEQPVGRILDKSGRGNHATQATTTKRPVLSRRVNLLTKTEQFDDAAWSKSASGTAIAPVVTPNAAMAPDGTMTADVVVFDLNGGATGSDFSQLTQTPGHASAPYSWGFWAKTSDGTTKTLTVVDVAGFARIVTVTGSYQRIEVSATGTAFPRIRLRGGEGTSSYASICLWGASLTLATDAHLPYQWVNTATDYDADPAKFPAYLRFDGVDDALQTGNIDFTGTDKMTVWAGVTKLSDAAQSVAVELSNSYSANSGTFMLSVTSGAGAASAGYISRGTAVVNAVGGNNPAPSSVIITATSDISKPSAALRVNHVAVTNNTVTQGTGSFGNYPLYIGARNAGSVQFLNGRIYQLIVRGAESSLSQIEATEVHIKQKMRLP